MQKKTNNLILTLIVVGIAALAALGVWGYRRFSAQRVNVYSVEELNEEDWEEEAVVYGTVTEETTQKINMAGGRAIKKVYVEDGDTVEIGDKLLEYDMTMTELDLTGAELNKQILELRVKTLDKQIAHPKKYLQAEADAIEAAVKNAPVRSSGGKADGSGSGGSSGSTGSAADTSGTESTGSAADTNNTESTGSAADTGGTANTGSVDGTGSTEGTGSGSMAADSLGKTADASTAFLAQTAETDGSLEGAADSAGETSDTAGAEARGDTGAVEDEEEGFTKEDIDEYVSEKKSELQETNLEILRNDLTIAQLNRKLEEKTVTSRINGVVSMEGDEEDDLLVVQGEGRLYVEGDLDEYTLEEVDVGTVLLGEDYMTGEEFEAEVQKISEYPEDTSELMDFSFEGTTSYYAFSAEIQDDVELTSGEEVELHFDEEEDGGAVLIDTAFVRQENGSSYVYLADEKKQLRKRRVEVGKIIDGSIAEIKSGVDLEDHIAFPYGKGIREGAKTKISEVDELYE